jgi:hypothetical protein
MTVYRQGHLIHHDLLNNLEKELYQESERDRELQTEVQVQHSQEKTIHSFKEYQWSSNFNPFNLDWLQFCTSFNLYFLKKLTGHALTPPILQVRQLLHTAVDSNLKHIAEAFDPRVWFSGNYLPVFASNRTPEKIGGVQQRPLHEILVYAKQQKKHVEIFSVGCLSIKDAAVWRTKLQNTGYERSTFKVFLYDVELNIIVAGDSLDLNLLHDCQDFHLLKNQCRFLNADVQYRQHEIPHFKDWIEKHDVAQLKKAFNFIHQERGVMAFVGSTIDAIFTELQECFLEDPI